MHGILKLPNRGVRSTPMLLENKVAVVTGVAYPTSKFAVNGFT